MARERTMVCRGKNEIMFYAQVDRHGIAEEDLAAVKCISNFNEKATYIVLLSIGRIINRREIGQAQSF